MDTSITKRPVIALTAAQSSQLKAFGYDEPSRTLAIQFHGTKHNPAGSIYHYSGVSPETFKDMSEAESKGSFFIGKIKTGGYSYEKLVPAPADEIDEAANAAPDSLGG